jgi:hypothetical protein
VLVEDLATPAVDVARGGADVGVGEPVERLAQEVDQPALALEQGEHRERALAVHQLRVLALVGRLVGGLVGGPVDRGLRRGDRRGEQGLDRVLRQVRGRLGRELLAEQEAEERLERETYGHVRLAASIPRRRG